MLGFNLLDFWLIIQLLIQGKKKAECLKSTLTRPAIFETKLTHHYMRTQSYIKIELIQVK